MNFSANGLDKKDLLGKSDPFLEFEKENPDGSYTLVYKTTVKREKERVQYLDTSLPTPLCNSLSHVGHQKDVEPELASD